MGVIDLFFPKQVKCVTCGQEVDKFGICEKCSRLLTLIPSPTCEICGGENIGKGKVCIECKGRHFEFVKNYSLFVYDGDVRNKVISFKQNGNKSIGEMFAYFIANKYDEIIKEHGIDLIIPVPISEDRRKTRKLNQSEILCSQILDKDKIDNSILKRTKDTPHQTGLSRQNREENLKDSFEIIDKKIVKGKSILIVDDIYTTGSTLNACSRVLKSAGAKEIYTLTLARAPIKKDKIID
jgi:ComF family protein